MNTRVLIIYWVILVIGVYYFRPFASRSSVVSEDADHLFAIEMPANHAVTLSIERGETRLEYRRAGDHWESVGKTGSPPVRSDLAERVVAAVTTGEQTVDVVDPAPSPEALEAFGLSPPASRVLIGTREGKEIRVELGSPNPSGLAVYGRTSLSPKVVLMGFNVRYYVDLALEAADEFRGLRASAQARDPAAKATRRDRPSKARAPAPEGARAP